MRLVQPAILAILREEPLHGYVIVRRLSRMTVFREDPPDARGVYRMLRSMETAGLVRWTWDASDRGPARRRFHLTGGGRACLALWEKTLDRYQRTIGTLLTEMREGAGERHAEASGPASATMRRRRATTA